MFGNLFWKSTVALACTALGVAIGYAGFSRWSDGRLDLEYVQLLVDSQRWEYAARLLERRLDQSPGDSRALVLLSRVHAGMGLIERCVQTLASVPDEAVLKPEALLREGQARMELHDAAGAEIAWRRCVEHALTDRGTARQAWRELATLYGTEDRTEELRAALWSLYHTAEDADRPALLQQLLDSRLLKVEPLVRAETLERFVAANPRDIRAKIALGQAYVEANRLDEALPLVEQCVKAAPEDTSAWRAWLRALYQQGDNQRLGRELPRAPAALREESGYYKLAANVAQEDGNWGEAKVFLSKALELAPFEPDLHSQFAVVLARLGEIEQAEEHGRTGNALRNAQNDLRAAYEDWLRQTADHERPELLRHTAERIAEAYNRCGHTDEAKAWQSVVTELRLRDVN